MDRLAGVLLIGILIAAWMFRWEITPSSAVTGNPAAVFFKLNRITGSTYICVTYNCYKNEAAEL
jgi:hypothetical protein